MPYELPPLPYDADALEPHISMQTMVIHSTKHHQGYADKLNGMIEGTELDDQDLSEIIRAAAQKDDQLLFNNAAQVWNHCFFWDSMTPTVTTPSDQLAAAIDDTFDDMAGFKKAFKEAATSQFGSGWSWLVGGADGLEILSTSNASLPLIHGKKALICCDVWEHAYYLDYQNERGKFVDTFLDFLINWDFASGEFAAGDDMGCVPGDETAKKRVS